MSQAAMKQSTMSQTNIAENKAQLGEKIKENEEKLKAIHESKLVQSNALFSNTKVTSCSSVLIKNGQAVCVGFKTANNKPDEAKTRRLSEHTSFAQ